MAKHSKFKYVKELGVHLAYKEGSGYYPITYDYNPKTKEVKYVNENPMLVNWLLYLKNSNKRRTKNGKGIIETNLYYDQHALAIALLIGIQECRGLKWLINVARQFGKSFLAKDLAVFCLLEMPRWSNVDFEVYNVLMTSYGKQPVDKLRMELLPKIQKNLDFFNRLHKGSELRMKGKGATINLTDNDKCLEISLYMDKKEEKYSCMWFLGAVSDRGRDGLSVNVMIADEISKIDGLGDGGFMQSFFPMMTSTGGTLIAMGITTSDSSSAGYILYKSDAVINYRRTWDKVYANKLANNVDDAERYKRETTTFKKTMGELSTEWLVNYAMSYDILDGKFMTAELMRNNKIMESEYGYVNNTNEDIYVVAGLDLGTDNDRTVLTVCEGTRLNKGGFKNEVKKIEIYNLNKKRLDVSELIDTTMAYLFKYKIDILLVDGSAGQKTTVNSIINKALEKNFPTTIVPFYFQNRNKVSLMQYLENALLTSRCKLPKEELIEKNTNWKIMYNELIELEKNKKPSGWTTYLAPKGKHDDCVMSLALAVYTCEIVNLWGLENKTFPIGDTIVEPILEKVRWDLLYADKNKEAIKSSWQLWR